MKAIELLQVIHEMERKNFRDFAIVDEVKKRLNDEIYGPPKPVEHNLCNSCWGSGWETQFITPCRDCNGTGKETIKQ